MIAPAMLQSNQMADKQGIINYWKKGAIKDRKAAKDLIELGHNDWALFIWHLVLEKLLKGLLVKEEKETVKTHNLFRLAIDLKETDFPDNYLEWLKEITTFNLEVRYNSYKFEFYKKATAAYTVLWDKSCEEIYQWLIKQF